MLDFDNECLKQKIEMESSQMSVQIEDALFSYGKSTKLVLNGLNMNVMKGEIYALLGSSGCGKTTVLKCITKTLRLKGGEIRLSTNFNKLRPRIPGPDVGYMPQELALFPDLTIAETLYLFGGINGVFRDTLKTRIEILTKAFGITPLNRKVGSLSGGQKRRVSLLAILLHDPPLLILDEPTVGIDPVLRQTIWKYLMSLAKNKGKTILITTHYIQEAKEATTVGLMRDGCLVAECSPTHLLRNFNETSLESCFYQICVRGNHNATNMDLFSRTHGQQYKDSSDVNVYNRFECIDNWNLRVYGASRFPPRSSYSSLRNVYTLLKKNCKVMTRNPVVLLFQFVFPALVMLLFGTAIGTNLIDVPVAIVNMESPPDYSDLYLQHLKTNSLNQKHFTNLEDGINSVKSGESTVALFFHEDFSKCLHNRLLLGVNTGNYSADCALIKMHFDNTNYVSSMLLQQTFWKTFEVFVRERLRDLDVSPYVDSVPLSFEKPIYGNSDFTFNDYFTPSILLYTIHYLAVMLTSVSLVLEKQNGTLQRLEICGLKSVDMILSQLLLNVVVVFVQVVFVMLVQFGLHGTQCQGNLALVALFIFLEGVCGMVFGLFLSAVCKTLYAVLMVGLSVSYINLFICGLIWPLEGLNHVLRIANLFLPLAMPSDALRSVITKGWGFESMAVRFGLGSVVAWFGIFLIGAMIGFKRSV